MKKTLLVLVVWSLVGAVAAAQEEGKKASDFHLGLDLQTKYIWRGMEMMVEDAAPVVFPQLNYQKGGLYAYAMGGYSINGKYAEVDLGASYTYKFLTVGLNDYYYPTINSPQDDYFNFKSKKTGHWLEAIAFLYEHGFGICNVELKYTYNVAFKNFTLPLSVMYIINPVYEKAHVNFKASFAF